MNFRNLIFAILMLLPINASANNSWSVYHWPSNNLSPTVVDLTRNDPLYDVSAGVQEWAILGTPIQPVVSTSRKSNVTVKVGFSWAWLGLARIYIDEEGHISKGEVLLNSQLLSRYGPAVADHVLCQELGHVWGLDHNRTEFDTCMNDSALLSSTAPYPNLHDAEQLNLIYDHTDVVPDSGDDESGGPPCSKKPDHPKCRATGWLTVHVFRIP